MRRFARAEPLHVRTLSESSGPVTGLGILNQTKHEEQLSYENAYLTFIEIYEWAFSSMSFPGPGREGGC
jgi:hypothetical protein